jgi:hypothetical protein
MSQALLKEKAMNTETHISRNDAFLYVFGRLPKEKSIEIEEHIEACKECFGYITYLHHKRMEACKRMKSLFSKALRDKLKGEEALFWDAHILHCDRCLESYMSYLHSKEEGLLRRFMGYLKGSALRPIQDSLMVQPVLVGKPSEGDSILKNVPLISFSKPGVEIFFFVDKKGSLRAYLKSKKFDPSGVAISIAHRGKRGYEVVHTAYTGKRGVANFGSIKKLPPPKGRRGYAVILSGLKEKEK